MKIITIELSVPCDDDNQDAVEFAEKLGDLLEEGLTESSWNRPTLAEELGCEGNTLCLSVEGEVVVEICL